MAGNRKLHVLPTVANCARVPDAPKRKRGRPLGITPAVEAKILERIETGRTLHNVMQDDDLPSEQALYVHMRKHPEFMESLVVSRQISAHGFAMQIVDIADACTDPAMTGIVRNQIVARQWLAGKYNSFYADKVINKHTGADDGPVLVEIGDKRAAARQLIDAAFTVVSVEDKSADG